MLLLKLYGPSSSGARPIAAKDGTIYKEKEQIRERWGEHFSELLNQEAQVDDNVLDGLPQLKTKISLAQGFPNFLARDPHYK